MWWPISYFLKRKIEPKNRAMYACLKGDYIGEMLIYINKENDLYNFITLPSKKPVSITLEVFKNGLENNCLEQVKIVPKKYWILLKYLYLKYSK